MEDYASLYSPPIMFFVPRANRVTDPYLETLFGYFPLRLSDSEFYTSELKVKRGFWAFGFNAHVPGAILTEPIIVRTGNDSIAEVGEEIEIGWKQQRLERAIAHFPFQVERDVYAFHELIAKNKGKCSLQVRINREILLFLHIEVI